MAQLLDVSINYFFKGLSDLDLSAKSQLRTSDVINLDTDAIRSVIHSVIYLHRYRYSSGISGLNQK